MQQRRRGLHPRLGLLASVVLVVGACGTAASPSPSACSPTGTVRAAGLAGGRIRSSVPGGHRLPGRRRRPVRQEGYTGSIKRISALSRLKVEFQLCAPDPAFLPKVAFAVFGIKDADYLEAHAADQSILEAPNGTGPAARLRGRRATGSSSSPMPTTGATRPDREPRVPVE